jgi:hypothetical protein
MALTSVNAKRPRLAPTADEAVAPVGVLTEVGDHYLLDEKVTVNSVARLLTRTRVTPEYRETLNQGSERRLKIEVLSYTDAFATGQTAYADGLLTVPFNEAAGILTSTVYSKWANLNTLYTAAGGAAT